MRHSTSTILRHGLALASAFFLTAALAACGGGGGGGGGTTGSDAGTSDVISNDDAGDDTSSPDTDESTASALTLTVRDLEGAPVDSASVDVGGTSETTGSDGTVEFPDLEPGRLVAEIDAEGFAPSTAVVELPTETEVHRTTHLLRSSSTKSFDASTPSDLYENRVHVQLPADALVDSDGETYTGKAELQITPLNPSTAERHAMPGPLMGVLEGDDEPTPMESIFMAEIRIASESGEELSLAEGKRATLEFVIPDALQDDYSNGDQIESYWYDREAGLWKQEGTGEVVESTYAAQRLAWQAEVSHFTWWNADKPWTDKNCANIEVVRKGSGKAVSGASVYVEGVSYNGVSYATTGKNGKVCADFKRGSKVEITAAGPNGYRQVGFGARISGSSTAATCSGQGSGSCKQVTIKLEQPTCLSGKVVDKNGNAVSGAEVVGTYQGAHGKESVQATTGSSGEYCLQVPPDHSVDITARKKSNGTFRSASQSVRANAKAKSCGSGSCTSAPDLTLKERKTACLSTSVRVDDPSSGPRSASAGTHVYAFAGSGDPGEPLGVDCSKPPKDWGTLLAETTTDAAGDFCLQVPKNVSDLTLAVGKCNGTNACVVDRGVSTSLNNTASCASGSCTTVESIGLPICADGP